MSARDQSIDVVIGDMFESSAQTWVNTVNTVGVMGKGVALEFKKRFPEMHRDYVRRCERGEVQLGRPYIFRRPELPHIINFPTKEHWRSVSKLKAIVAGLEYLERNYAAWEVTSLAVPPLGCGQGGLEWKVVGPTLFQHLQRLAIPVELYAPYGTPHEELQPRFLQRSLLSTGSSDELEHQRVKPAWVALVAALARIQDDPHHWPIGKISFQKLAYFATAAGLPTGLTFERGSYGPFAAGLTQIVSKLVNHDLIEQKQRGRMIAHVVGSTYADATRAYADELERWTETIDRLADLFARLRTTRSAEVAATVHFAAAALEEGTEQPPSESAVLENVLEWKQRKDPPLRTDEITIAMRSLAMLGWLRLEPSPELDVDEAALVGL